MAYTFVHRDEHRDKIKMKTEQEKLSEASENTTTQDFNAIEAHNKIITHLEEGKEEEERQSIICAQHHASLAAEAQTEMLKHFPFTS